MKKQTNLIFVLVILISACVMSAGCIDSDSGPVGQWNMTAQSADATYVYTNAILLFNEDGTGLKTCTSDENITNTDLFMWTAVNKTTYDCLFMYIVDLTDNETTMTIGGYPASFSGNGFVGTWFVDYPLEFDDGIFNGMFTFKEDGTGYFEWYFLNGTRESNFPLAWVWYENGGFYAYNYLEEPYTCEFTILPNGTGIAVYDEIYWETYINTDLQK